MQFTSRCLRTWVSKWVTQSRHLMRGLRAPCPCPPVHALCGIFHLTFLASQMQGKQFQQQRKHFRRRQCQHPGSMGLQIIHVLFAFFRSIREKSGKSLKVSEATLSTSLCKRRRGLGERTFFRALVGGVLVLTLCLLVFFFDQRCSSSTLQKVAGRLEGLEGPQGIHERLMRNQRPNRNMMRQHLLPNVCFPTDWTT